MNLKVSQEDRGADKVRSVEEERLRERPELASEPEFLRLVGQCSILVVIAGIVAGLIAA